jgi:hypothetical protein
MNRDYYETPHEALLSDSNSNSITRPVECGRCGWSGNESDVFPLCEIKNLASRLEPGCEIPVGECKNKTPASWLCCEQSEQLLAVCGGLVYYADIEVAYRPKLGILDRIVEKLEGL